MLKLPRGGAPARVYPRIELYPPGIPIGLHMYAYTHMCIYTYMHMHVHAYTYLCGRGGERGAPAADRIERHHPGAFIYT